MEDLNRVVAGVLDVRLGVWPAAAACMPVLQRQTFGLAILNVTEERCSVYRFRSAKIHPSPFPTSERYAATLANPVQDIHSSPLPTPMSPLNAQQVGSIEDLLSQLILKHNTERDSLMAKVETQTEICQALHDAYAELEQRWEGQHAELIYKDEKIRKLEEAVARFDSPKAGEDSTKGFDVAARLREEWCEDVAGVTLETEGKGDGHNDMGKIVGDRLAKLKWSFEDLRQRTDALRIE